MSFSIIIPCYNCEKTLSRTIDSLLIQQEDLKNIILIDDGSQDKTAEIAQQYEKLYPNLIEYHYQENQGPAKARNHGIQYIRGEYTLFLDGDDTLTPRALAQFTEAFLDYPQIDLMVAGYASIHGNTVKEKLLSDYKTNELLLKAFWFGDFSLCGGGTAMRSHLLQYVQYPETIKHGEDIVFFSHLIAEFPARSLPFIALQVYHHEDSLRHDDASTLQEGEAIIPLLFNPKYLSQEMMEFKTQFQANHLISLARVAIKHKKYLMARNFLSKAYRIYPESMYHLKTLRALLAAYTHKDG